MNINTLLINSEYVRNNSTISDNMEDCYIIPSIKDAQLSGLMPLIGEPLYDAICTKVEDDTITATENADYKALLDDYIALFLLYTTIGNMTIDNFQRQHNAGSVNYTDTNYNQIALNELKYMQQHWSDKAAFYANRLTDHLHHNSTKYPEYHRHICGQMQHNDIANTYRCGINLNKSYQRRRKDR